MHDEFLAVPGYAAQVARPRRHNPESFGWLRERVVGAFVAPGAEPEEAEQSWYVFGSAWCSGWARSGTDPARPRFDLFLDTLPGPGSDHLLSQRHPKVQLPAPSIR
jgi:hypothetical protein